MSCPFSKENFNTQNIKNAMKQACTDVYHLLENITYNFKVNGVNYNATQFYKVVVRIVTPFELLSQYHLVDNQALNIPQQIDNNFEPIQPIQPLKSNILRAPIFLPNMPNPEPKKEENMQIHETAYPMRYRKVGRPRSENKSNDPGKNQPFFPKKFPKNPSMELSQELSNQLQSKNKIDPAMQKLVYQWTLTNFKNGRKLQMSDICRYAKSVSKNKLFQASSGWCANFLKRHLDIRAFVKSRGPFQSESEIGIQNYLSRYPPNDLPQKIPMRPNDQTLPYNLKQNKMFEKRITKLNQGFPRQQSMFSNEHSLGLSSRNYDFPQGRTSTKIQRKNSQSYEQGDLYQEDEDEEVAQELNESQEKKENSQPSNPEDQNE